MRFKFDVGERVALDEGIFSLRQQLDGNRWRLEREDNGEYVIRTQEEMLTLYRKNALKFISEDLAEQNLGDVEDKISLSFSDYPQTLRELAKQRLTFVKKVSGLTQGEASGVIKDVAWQLDIEAPSVQAVFRWRKRYEKSGKNICSLIPNFDHRGNRTARYPVEVLEISIEFLHKNYLSEQRKSIDETLSEIRKAITAENSRRDNDNKLPQPERKFIRNIIKGMDAYEVDRARYGEGFAKRKYREALKSGERIENPLDRVEIDHTILDLIVVTDEDYLPIGRPTLSVALDRCTRCVLGYHISFDPPSYVSVQNCLAHGIAPKDYVKEKYSDIKNSWPCWGLPQKIVVDNGMEFHSADLEAGALSLLIDIQYCPRKQPWFKGAVERFFKTQNEGLVHALPGTTFSNIIDRGEYKSMKLAVVSESLLHELMHMWIVDVYHQTRHRQIQMAPGLLWNKRIDSVLQTLPESSEKLQIELASTETKSLFHYGIQLNYLNYNSKELMLLRKKYGEKKMQIKWDKRDLGHIYVIDNHQNMYLKVPCTWPEYATGLSLWMHKHIRGLLNAEGRNAESREELDEAKERIRVKITQALSDKKQTTRKIAARAQQSFARKKADVSQQTQQVVTVENTLLTETPIEEEFEIPVYDVSHLDVLSR